MVGVVHTRRRGGVVMLGSSGAPTSHSPVVKCSLALLWQKEGDGQDCRGSPGRGFGGRPNPPPPTRRKLPNAVVL